MPTMLPHPYHATPLTVQYLASIVWNVPEKNKYVVEKKTIELCTKLNKNLFVEIQFKFNSNDYINLAHIVILCMVKYKKTLILFTC